MGPQERRILAGFGWGIVAAVAMGALMVFGRLAVFGDVAHTIPIRFTERFIEDFIPAQPGTATIVALGVGLHLLYGGFWAAFTASMFEPMTPLRGMVLGVFLWVLAGMVVMPYLGLGLFGAQGPSGLLVATLLAHLVYGFTYGALLDPGLTVRQSAKRKVGMTA